MSVMSCGRVFHSRPPATEKALSPKTVLVMGMSNWPLAAAWSLFRPGNVDRGWTMSRMYCGHWPVTAACIIRHNLKLIWYLIGNQWSFFICPVTWSRGPRPAMRRIAALRTRRNGSSVVDGSPDSTALQYKHWNKSLHGWMADDVTKLTQLTKMEETKRCCSRNMVMHGEFAVQLDTKISSHSERLNINRSEMET